MSRDTHMDNVRRFKLVQELRDRQWRPIWVGWLSGGLTLAVLGVGLLAAQLLNTFYAVTDLPWNELVTLMVTTACTLAILLSAVGLPVWYSGSIRGTLLVMLHALGFLAGATVIALILLVLSGRQPNQNPVPAGCGGVSASDCNTPL